MRCEDLEEAADLVIIELVGSDNAKEHLLRVDPPTISENIKATIAYHILQSNMYFAEKETGDSKDEILKSWDRVIDPRMSDAWRMIQSYWWCP